MQGHSLNANFGTFADEFADELADEHVEKRCEGVRELVAVMAMVELCANRNEVSLEMCWV